MRKKLKYHQLIQKNKKELLNNKDDLDRIDELIDQRRTSRKKENLNYSVDGRRVK